MDMVREVLDQSAADKLKTIPLSNDTICRRIEDMSDDVKQQTTARIQKSAYYALQMDESTDIANHATLLVYVRYVWEGDLEEQILCSRDLPTTTTAEDIFSTVDLYLGSLGLSWQNCVGITTDGAASMTGKHSGVVKRILERASNATWNHCFLHREALAAKKYVRFNDYFPEKHDDDPWISDPFGIDVESVTLPSNEENQLVELSCDKTLKKKFSEVSLSQFWCREVLSEYPSLATRAIKSILPFSTTYLCESGFSSLVQLKSKQRNRLDIEHDLRVALSTITPDFETLIRSKAHPQLSH
ncbi:hypothetical protein QQF64_023964 [Cirrhinus molitorella]|uniref:Transposase n=1 Tax=Cirrhinus molitorella TaxID=172907 RepID=A0ABR3NKH8_9TELE